MSEPSDAITAGEAAKLTSRWLRKPMLALGGRTTANYVVTVAGQEQISDLLEMALSCAYP